MELLAGQPAWNPSAGASEEELAALECAMGVRLQFDCREVPAWANGAGGPLGLRSEAEPALG